MMCPDAARENGARARGSVEVMLRPPNRSIAVLFVCVAFASTGMFTAITVGAIAAVETAGSRGASGLPAALAILGTALGAIGLGVVIGRSSWRRGMRMGWLLGALGGLVAAAGVQHGSFLLVLAGMFAIGFGNSGTQLARYAAAQTVSPQLRGTAVAWTVWAAAIGAVTGPVSLGATGRIASGAGYEPGVGGFGLVVATLLAAQLVVSLFRPVAWQEEPAPPDPGTPAVDVPPAAPGDVSVPAAVGCLVAAQSSMVMVMAITPVHLNDGGHAYGVVGTVMSGHFVGMFALAPLVGWMSDRMTPSQSVRTGLLTLATGAMLAAALPLQHGAALSLPLLLVGLGWCMCFVASSAAVASSLAGPKEQGRVDSLVWFGAATSSTLSGLLLAQTSYASVALVAMTVSLVVALVAGGRVGATIGRPVSQPAA